MTATAKRTVEDAGPYKFTLCAPSAANVTATLSFCKYHSDHPHKTAKKSSQSPIFAALGFGDDAVLLFGPLYHLLDEEERQQCVREVHRVLRAGGQVFAAFIPKLSGAIAIVDRACFAPHQVNRENLRHVFRTGQFINNASTGFQEGYYPTSDEIVSLFGTNGFEKTHLSSIRGFAYEKEEKIFNLQDERMRQEILHLAEETSEEATIIETCGHALYIGKKS